MTNGRYVNAYDAERAQGENARLRYEMAAARVSERGYLVTRGGVGQDSDRRRFRGHPRRGLVRELEANYQQQLKALDAALRWRGEEGLA